MASLLVVLIILGCVAYQYLKGTLVKSFTMLVTTICASVTAFAYFELLAKVFIARKILVPWAQPLSFILLFVLAFAILKTVAAQLTHQRVKLGLLAERIGRALCGIFLGLIVSGLLLTAFAMAPIPANYPYQRFDRKNPNAERPDKVLLNADGFATGWFSIISSGSFSGRSSFAALHPAFLDQLFLNRHEIADGVSIITSPEAIEIPKKKAVWPAPEDIKDSDGRPVSTKSGHNLTIVRVGMTTKMIKKGKTFTLSQLRLICKRKGDAKNLLAGKGINIYPLGYLKTADQLQIKRLNDRIKLERADFDGRVKEIDFAFYVPAGFIPALVEFKQNSVARVPPPVTSEQAPLPLPFIPLSECATDSAKLEPITSAKIYGVELATGSQLLAGLTLNVADPNHWQSIQTDRSIKPAEFKDGKLDYVRAELRIEKPAQPAEEDQAAEKKPWEKRRAFLAMLKRLSEYKLLSLKCNNPSTGAAITAEHLPVLIEVSGLIHHAVGIAASGKLDDQTTIYEVDYCCLTTEDLPEGLTIAEDGSVAQPFPDTLWLPQQVRNISEFYVLYLVKSGRNAIITSVQPADSQIAAGFKKCEGFSVK